MRNDSGYQGENERHWTGTQTYNISFTKRVTRKLKEVSRFSRTRQRKENVQKSVLHVQSCFFASQIYCC